MRTKTILLIMWSIIFVINIVSAATGHEASWICTFCPLVCYIMELGEDVFFNSGEYDDKV